MLIIINKNDVAISYDRIQRHEFKRVCSISVTSSSLEAEMNPMNS